MNKKSILFTFVFLAMVLVGCRREETITITTREVSFPREAGWRSMNLTANCDWTISIDDGADWYTISPMTGSACKKLPLTITANGFDSDDYRTSTFTITSKRGRATATVRVSQNVLSITEDELWFTEGAETQTIGINAKCNWTVTIEDGADWYTVSPMSGSTIDNGNLTVTVQPYEGTEFRSSSFLITPDIGEGALRVRLSQNVLEFGSIVNTIFGVSFVEHWNTDFYGHLIEDSYISGNFDPNDTMTGFTMYFLENGEGLQRDVKEDSVYIWPFTYLYDSASRNLNIEFETGNDSTEIYNLNVLTATNRLFRFFHEFSGSGHSWERANMKKIGDIAPHEKSLLKRNAKKRSGRGPLFRLEK